MHAKRRPTVQTKTTDHEKTCDTLNDTFHLDDFLRTRIGDLERNIKDEIQAKTKDAISKIDSTENSLKQRIENFEKEEATQFEKQSKENKLLKILLFVSIGLGLVILIIQLIR